MKKKYWNNQKYWECQLVAFWNAAKYHNMPVPEQFGKEYEQYCVKYCCTVGACLQTDKALKELNLKFVKGSFDKEWISTNFPSIYYVFCKRGFHAILAIGMDGDKIVLANYAINRLHKMTIDKLLTIVPCPNRCPDISYPKKIIPA